MSNPGDDMPTTTTSTEDGTDATPVTGGKYADAIAVMLDYPGYEEWVREANTRDRFSSLTTNHMAAYLQAKAPAPDDAGGEAEATLDAVRALLDRLDASSEDYDTDTIRAVLGRWGITIEEGA